MTPFAEHETDRLIRLWVGECLPAEAEATTAWIEATPERAAAVHALRQVWEASTRSYAAEASAVVARVMAEVRQVNANGDDRASRRSPILGKQALRGQGLVIGALFAGAALVAIVAAHGVRNHPVRTLVVRSPRVYATAGGQQATLTLANGVRARLGPATTLTVSTDASTASTLVTLIGQAQFVVAHDAQVPFLVQTENAVARVLGTTFMVRKYETDRVAQVIVTEGRVSLSATGHGMGEVGQVLVANMLGTVDDSGIVRVTPNVAVTESAGWTTGELIFHQTPVRDLVAELSRVYGVDIRVIDPALATRAISWKIPLGQRSLSGVLDILADVLDAHPVRAGRVITLIPGRSASPRPTDSRTLNSSETLYGR